MKKRNYFTLDDMLKITDYENYIIVKKYQETIFTGDVKGFYQSEDMKQYYDRDVHSINHQNTCTFIYLL